MDSLIKVDVSDNPNIETFKKRLAQMPNGTYAVKACTKCGRYWSQPDPDTLEIVHVCRDCFED